jgi:hypothetical protein
MSRHLVMLDSKVEIENLATQGDDVLVFCKSGHIISGTCTVTSNSVSFSIKQQYERIPLLESPLIDLSLFAIHGSSFDTPKGRLICATPTTIGNWPNQSVFATSSSQESVGLSSMVRIPLCDSGLPDAKVECVTLAHLRLQSSNLHVNLVAELPVPGNHTMRLWLEVLDFDSRTMRVIPYPMSIARDLMPGHRRVSLHHV